MDEARRSLTDLPDVAADRVAERLVRERSDLAADPETLAEVGNQVRLIAASAMAQLGADQPPPRPARDAHDAVLGGRRAAAHIHPTTSLRAATLAFQETYPLLMENLGPITPEEATRAANALQEVLGATILSAATGYVDHLLNRLSAVHLEERRALARHLHDHTTQGIAAALQRVRLLPEPNADLESLLADALDDTRAIALELRQLVGDRRLDEALSAYLDDLPPSPGQVRLTQQGVPRRLPPLTQEEAFLIIREAVLNARKHAGAERIDVSLVWKLTAVTIAVSDDGRGFDPRDAHASRMGLLISRERADAISASLEIRSVRPHGTRVELVVTG